MIQVEELTARTSAGPKITIGPVSFTLEQGGAYALVGAPSDGVELLLGLFAGSERRRKGTITVSGRSPVPRPGVAYVPYEPDLPNALDAREYLVLAGAVRGEPGTSPEARLAVLGIGALASRRIATLSIGERRALALVEALTSRAELLLLADPLVELDPRAVSHVAAALEARLAAGATTVVTSASTEDAEALSHDWLFFARGKLSHRATRRSPWLPPALADGVRRLFIRSEGARLLLAELAPDPTFLTVDAEGAALVVTGKDPVAMAGAVAAANRRANVELDVLRFETGVSP